MQKEKAGETNQSQTMRLLEHINANGNFSTIDARRMGIMHPGMRVCELRKLGYQIDTVRKYQVDESGVIHLVAVYILRVGDVCQPDLFGEAGNA